LEARIREKKTEARVSEKEEKVRFSQPVRKVKHAAWEMSHGRKGWGLKGKERHRGEGGGHNFKDYNLYKDKTPPYQGEKAVEFYVGKKGRALHSKRIKNDSGHHVLRRKPRPDHGQRRRNQKEEGKKMSEGKKMVRQDFL